jgi:hypothetical protein
MAARTTAVVSFAICFIFGVGCSWCGAVAKGGSWGGCVDNGGSCGVVSKLSDGLFGALAGARFFFGFRPRLLGIGEQYAPRLNNTASATAASPAAPTAARAIMWAHALGIGPGQNLCPAGFAAVVPCGEGRSCTRLVESAARSSATLRADDSGRPMGARF